MSQDLVSPVLLLGHSEVLVSSTRFILTNFFIYTYLSLYFVQGFLIEKKDIEVSPIGVNVCSKIEVVRHTVECVSCMDLVKKLPYLST